MTCFPDGQKTIQQYSQDGKPINQRYLRLSANGQVVESRERLNSTSNGVKWLLVKGQETEARARKAAERGEKLAREFKEKYPITAKDIKRLETRFS